MGERSVGTKINDKENPPRNRKAKDENTVIDYKVDAEMISITRGDHTTVTIRKKRSKYAMKSQSKMERNSLSKSHEASKPEISSGLSDE